MPIYEYRCQQCGKEFEVIQKLSDPPLATCEQCAGPLEKLISQSAFQLKGSGWYVTDYARKAQGGDKKEGGKADRADGSKTDGDKSDSAKSDSGKSDGGKSDGSKEASAASGGTSAEKPADKAAEKPADKPSTGGGESKPSTSASTGS